MLALHLGTLPGSRFSVYRCPAPGIGRPLNGNRIAHLSQHSNPPNVHLREFSAASNGEWPRWQKPVVGRQRERALARRL
jgi:hypothetical protein